MIVTTLLVLFFIVMVIMFVAMLVEFDKPEDWEDDDDNYRW